MVVKKYNDFIEEGFMTRSLNRKKDGDLRLEDGVKVKNQYGSEIIIRNTDCDYIKISRMICDSGVWGDFQYTISHLHSFRNRVKYDEIKEDKNDYSFLISDVDVITYPEFDELPKNRKDLYDLSEEDYKSILRGIVEAIRNTKFVIINKQIYFTLIDEKDSLKIKKRLYDEDDLEYGEVIVDDFKEQLLKKVPNNIRLDFREWGSQNPCIGVRFVSFTLLNYEKFVRFAKKFFKI